MASTEVEIANSALIKVGAARITSLEEEVKGARIIKEQLPKLRDDLLMSHPWNFAIKRTELGATTETPLKLQIPDDFTYQFQLPNDCLRVLDTNLIFPDPWQVEGDKLLATNDSIIVKYISRITDPSRWSANFSEVLALRIASDIAYSLSQSITLAQQIYALYENKLSQARSFDAQEGQVKQVEANEWFDRRY